MNKKLLISWETYNKTEYITPHSFVLEKDGQFLFYFGSNHTYDPANSQFNEIRKFWQQFLDKSGGQNVIAVIEGGNREALPTELEAIQAGGEMHFVTHLAQKVGVITMSPEPSDKERYEVLLKAGFSKEEIIYHEFARVCAQWGNMIEKPDFKTYVGKFLASDSRQSGWTDFDFTVDHMKKIHKDLFVTDFDQNDEKFFYDITNPTIEKTVINKISRWDDEEYRDLYILEQLEKLWQSGKNLFIIYGSSHAIRQEPVIRDFVG